MKAWRFLVLCSAWGLQMGLVGIAQAYTDAEYDAVQTDKERQVQEIRSEEIRTIKRALSLRVPEQRKAELYQRLAELYTEEQRAFFLLEGRIQESKKNSSRIEKRKSTESLKNGITAAEIVEKTATDRRDEILYFLAFNLGELEQKEKSLSYYRKIVDEHPKSKFVAYAYVELAQDAEKRSQYTEAEQYFRRALASADEPARGARIHQKLAWVMYRQKRTDDAIVEMKRAVQLAQGNEKFLSIREEGLRDLALFFAERGQVDEAVAYFKTNAGGMDKLARALEKLGKEYERSGQLERAESVFKKILVLNTGEENDFRVRARLIEIQIRRQHFSDAAKELEGTQIPKTQDVDTLAAIQSLKSTVRKTAVDQHEAFRKTEDKEQSKKYLVVAENFYTFYFKKFLQNDSDAGERNEVRMYLAEIKRDLGKPGEAALLYRTVVQEKDAKFAQDAGQNWVSSLASALKSKSPQAGVNTPLGGESRTLPSDQELEFVEASDLMEKATPGIEQSREARLRSAQILAAYPDRKPEAMARASRLAQVNPANPQSLLAARLWLQLAEEIYKSSPRELEDQLIVVRSQQGLLAFDAQKKGELNEDLLRAERALRISRIAELERTGKFTEAALSYEHFSSTVKTEKEAEAAWVGAMNAYAQEGKSDEVARIMAEWKRKFPKSQLLEKSAKLQATQFFIKGMFAESAELFLGFGRQFKDAPAHLTAASLFEGVRAYPKAMDTYRMTLPMMKSDLEKAQVYRRLGLAAIHANDPTAQEEAWQGCMRGDTPLKGECAAMSADLSFSLGKEDRAQSQYQEIARGFKGKAAKTVFSAYAQYRLAELAEKKLKLKKLEFPEDHLLKTLTERVEEFAPVSAMYQKSIVLGGIWGIAATEKLARLAEAFVKDIEAVIRDKNARDEIKQTLTHVAEQLKKKTLENATQAYQLALKEKLLSPALPMTHQRVVELGGKGFFQAQGARLGTKLMGMNHDGGKLGRESALKSVRERLLKTESDPTAWIDYGNLLWGEGKPGLSKVAYDRAASLKGNEADALNNLGVAWVAEMGIENWVGAIEAQSLWSRALALDPEHPGAQFNLGHIYNYYRLFKLALPYFEKVASRLRVADIYDGLGVAYAGLGLSADSKAAFDRAEQMKLNPKRFTTSYIAQQCDVLGSIKDEVKGFEAASVERALARCSR